MKKHLPFIVAILSLVTLGACSNNNGQSSVASKQDTSSSKAPKKSLSDLSISLGNNGDKAYITVRGKQSNYITSV